MAAISHFKAMTTDPGAVPPDAKPIPDPTQIESELEDLKMPKRTPRICRRCNSYKPPRAHHCRYVSTTFSLQHNFIIITFIQRFQLQISFFPLIGIFVSNNIQIWD